VQSEDLVRKFKRHGYKMTPQRRAILEAIAMPGAHPTAEQIHESVRQSMPDTSLATVYNMLRELLAIQEVYELDLGHGVRRYEIAEEEHAHLVCLNCQCIRDMPADFDHLKAMVAEHDGFRPVRYDVTVYGYCDECLEEGSAESHREKPL
jgi:Fur family transcriptional regulator, stress-responsive regulator